MASRWSSPARGTSGTDGRRAVAFVPRDFAVPEPPATGEFVLAPLRVDPLVLDYEAVMSSRKRLWSLFGKGWGWPRADLSLMQDLVDLGGHQKEFQLQRAFNWAVLSADERDVLGCCCLDPSERRGFDAEAFGKVAFPGRDHPWRVDG